MVNSIVDKKMDANVAQLPVADRLWMWFDTYKKHLVAGVGALCLIGLVVWFVLYQREQKQIEAGSALTQVATGQGDVTGQRNENPDAYLKVAKEYPNSMTGARASLLAAGALFAEGKYTDAQAQFDRFTREYPGNPLMGEALLGVAACLDAENKSDQALSAYNDLVTRHPNDSFVPQAKFAMGRIYESQNKLEKARDEYQDVARTSPMSSIGDEAGVRLVELIAKNPSLAPAAPVSSAPPTAITNLAPLLNKK